MLHRCVRFATLTQQSLELPIALVSLDSTVL